MHEISLSIEMEPFGYKRPRSNFKTKRVHADPEYQRKKTEFAKTVKLALQKENAIKHPSCPLQLPALGNLKLAVRVEFFFEYTKEIQKLKNPELRAKKIEEKIPGRNDLDNLAKAVLDALNEVVWQDDRQVMVLQTAKAWAEKNKIILKVFPIYT